MCQSTIEKAASSVPGVAHAMWNKETKVFTMHFDKTKTSIEQVSKAIANSGYKTEFDKENESAYQELPECCKYKSE